MTKKTKQKLAAPKEYKAYSMIRVSKEAGEKVFEAAERDKRSQAKQIEYILEQWAASQK